MNAPRRPDHDGVLRLLALMADQIVSLEEWIYADKQIAADSKAEIAALKARVAYLEEEHGPVGAD